MPSPSNILAPAAASAALAMALSGCLIIYSPVVTPIPTADAVTVDVAEIPVLGKYLTDGAGRTLYMFTKDSPGASNCTGDCTTLWPPYTVPPDAPVSADPEITASVDSITWPDGSAQITVNGFPVYYFSGDQNQGDVFGQGYQGFWFVLDPAGNPVTVLLPTPATSQTPY